MMVAFDGFAHDWADDGVCPFAGIVAEERRASLSLVI
jgi:hypothetical protein